jgi:dienelactone hydrolase
MRFARTLLATAAAVLFVAAPASANIVPTVVKTLPVTVPASVGGYSVGNALLTVSYTDNDATATVTAPTLALGKGQYLRINTCLKRHVLNNSYETKCNQSFLDTRKNLGPVTIAAPSQQLKSPRPATSTSSGYFSYAVIIYARQADGSTYKEVASSWPGITKGSVAIAPKGLTTGAAVASEGAAVSSGATGGMNSWLPDSFCGADSRGATVAPPAGVSTTGLPSGAPAYYEVGEPTGEYEGQAPKGVMLVIHGGGWSVVGGYNVQKVRPEADRWRARGWRTLNITYHSCSQSIADVKWFYDAARTTWGTSMPYCATGQSAGAHLSLLLAASRPTVNCVIAEAGPTDMTSLKSQSVDLPDPVAASDGSRQLYNMMASAFGGDDQAIWFSPAQWKINARVLWGVGGGDSLVPAAQGDLLKDKMLANDPNAYIDVEHLAAGSTWWVHTAVSQEALDSFYAAEEKLVAPLTT